MTYQLAIDIGNSRSKMGLFQAGHLAQLVAFKNEDLDQNSQVFSNFEISHVIVSSVNEDAERRLNIEQQYPKVLHLNYKTKLPISLGYESPETLGKDRIAAVVGAKKQFSSSQLLVIDAGSCITYDFLTEGVYLGGAISPGIQMRLKAMNDFTNKLPLIDWSGEERPQTIGKTTITSMLSGTINGILGEMKGFIKDYLIQYPKLQTVITGGDANFFEKELKNGIFADPNLVLKGLNEILLYNNE